MLDVVLAGAAGSGKTTLLAALSLLLGRGSVSPPGAGGCLQLSLRRGRHGSTLRVWDSPGLSDTIDPDPARRHQQAIALDRLLAGFPVIHVVDAARAGEVGLSPLDECLAALHRQPGRCCLVATRMDRPWAHTGLQRLRQRVAPVSVLPVCAPAGQGLGQVKAFLTRLAHP